MWTLSFWKETGELAIRGGAQMVLTAWVVGDGIANAFEFDYQLGLGAFAGGAVISVLTSLIASGFNVKSSPTFTSEVYTDLPSK